MKGNRSNSWAAGAVLSLSLLLAACGEKGSTTTDSAGGIKMDAFCQMEGLPPALRETTVVVDAASIVPAEPEGFRNANPELFALILGVGDPSQTA